MFITGILEFYSIGLPLCLILAAVWLPVTIVDALDPCLAATFSLLECLNQLEPDTNEM